jgi:hypothetical protein
VVKEEGQEMAQAAVVAVEALLAERVPMVATALRSLFRGDIRNAI